MSMQDASNKDSRGRRKSSPAASQFYSRKIHNINDPDGHLESEINRTAKRLHRAIVARNTSRIIVMRERLVLKCMAFFYVTGENVSVRDDNVKHEGHYSQVDGIFIDTLMQVVNNYDPAKGLFTHMLRQKYSFRRTDAAYKAALADTRFGGNDKNAPISLNSKISETDDKSTVGDMLSDDYLSMNQKLTELDCNECKEIEITEVLEESGALTEGQATGSEEDFSDYREDAILLRTVTLISDFMGKTGRAANETRKLYTRMFFSETLTRVTKLRTKEELGPLINQEKNLLRAVEIAFQDSYTTEKCRTIDQLWLTAFREGIPPISKPLLEDLSKPGMVSNYKWTLPAFVYVDYLTSLGKNASNVLVSQQRSHYENLLSALSA